MGHVVGVTGSRAGMSLQQIETFAVLIAKLDIDEFHHGDCVGVDAETHSLVRAFHPDAKIVLHPPTDPLYRAFCSGDFCLRELPYLQRNHEIVRVVTKLFAIPSGPERTRGSGTWATIRFATKLEKDLTIIDKKGDIIASAHNSHS